MASRTRNQIVKADIEGTIVDRIATNGLVSPRYDALYYEILKGLDVRNLPGHKQVAAVLFASTTCQIIAISDCRQLTTEADFQERLVQAQDLDALYARLCKLFDKLNSGQTKEKTTDEDKQDIGETLQALLAKHSE